MISNIIFLILGTVLTLIAGIIASKLKQRQLITDKLLEYYFEARKEIVEVVSKLADLKIKYKLTEDEKDRYRENVARQYFKNTSFLPIPVLDSLLTLHACLLSNGKKLYQVRDRRIVPIPESGYEKFIDEFARFRNTKLFSKVAFKSKNNNIKRNLAIKLHAQHVLFSLNKYVSTEKLLGIPKGLGRKPGL